MMCALFSRRIRPTNKKPNSNGGPPKYTFGWLLEKELNEEIKCPATSRTSVQVTQHSNNNKPHLNDSVNNLPWNRIP